MKNFSRLRALFFLTAFIAMASVNAFSQCNCTFTIPAGTGIYTFDGVVKGAKPGDVICLAAGFRERLVFKNLAGAANNYIKIINCGGQTLVGGPAVSQAISFSRSRYFQLSGTGDAGYGYGISILGSSAGTQGVHIADLSSDCEVDHLEITKTGFAGIMAKSDPSKDCSIYIYERPNFTMTNIIIHDNYVHDIGGEGIYAGNSFYFGATNYCGSRTQYPHEIRGVRIYNNIFDNCGWESIQLGCAVDDVEIHDNKVLNYGTANVYAQNGGIQIGVGTTAKVYNNFVKKGTGIAILVQGIGNNFVYNNVIVNSGTYAILMSLKATPLVTDIVPKGFLGPVRIMNNTIINPSLNDAVVKESVVGPLGNVLYNNLVVGGQSNWLKLRGDTDWKTGNNVYIPLLADAKFTNPAADDYSLLPGSPAINVGRDVAALGVTTDFLNNARPAGGGWDVGAFEFGGKQKPVVSVGANQSLVLPTNTTTITGSATDADGTISSYLWTKQSGPTATITNETTTTVSLTDLVAGVYVFRLSATDNDGEVGFADVTITVTDPSVNQPPVANAGGNKTITLPTSTLVLNGSGSDPDGTIITYAWVKVSGPAATLANETTATLTLSGLSQGTYVFRLTVTDGDGDSDFDDATIIVNPAAVNQNPTANAGADKNLVMPTNSVNLSGSGADADGTIATYLWTKQSGGAATLTNTTSPTLQLTGLAAGSYVFRLTVTDNNGATGFDEATVTVTAANQAPTANAGGNKTIQLPTNSTTLSGSGSDIDGTIATYLWIKVSGPTATLTNSDKAVLSLSNLLQGTYVFRLTVTDNAGASGSSDATVTVQAANISPTANAGSSKTLTLPINNTTLNGSGSDPDGTISTYLWEKLSGPSATLTGSATATLSLTNLVEGSYVFRLTVTDNNGASGNSSVTVSVLPATVNQAPVVDVGADNTLTLPTNSIAITGTATDPDGTISTYVWEKVSGPSATLSGTTTATLSASNLIEGVYIFRLSVTDNGTASASDDVTITVTSSNQLPVVNGGSNQIIVLPTTSTTLNAVASDPDGTIATYLWTVQSGPNAPGLVGANSSSLSVSGLTDGTYVFRITVTDNNAASSSDDVNVVVQAGANINPVASAGSDVTLFLPTNSATLAGSASDADGTIATYAWSQISGVAATLANANTSTLSVSNLVGGVFKFRLTVTDNGGGSGIDDVTITVTSTNQPPVASAGPDIALTLPVNSTNLIGSGSDIDGTVSSYSWIKVSGPSATLSNQNTPVLSLQDLVEGVYIFRLTIADNGGLPASDDAQVTVFPTTVNQPPSVSAGNNRTITLPTNTAVISATASDADGSITSYAWTKQIGPTVTLSGESTNDLTLTNLVEGIYNFRITVTDNIGATSFDEITITVQAAGANQPPVVNAGIDKILFLPTNSINLAGTASDADGTVATYLWTKTSGPTATIANGDKPTATFSGLVAGQYIFRLTTTDDDGDSGFDEASVTVFPGTVNQPPIANAGANQTIVLPNTTTSLGGSGFDPDGSIVSYSWTQTAGPSCTLNNIGTPTLLIDDLTAGVFQFQLTVQDNSGAAGSSTATITVVAAGFNQPPSANAGFDQIINLPLNSTEIQGSGIDLDGTISAYSWIKKSGPATVTIAGQNTAKLSLSDLVAGTYLFALTVTDDDGLSNTDEVKVTVIQGSVNNNPTVNAGNDIFIRLPISSSTLTATASDIDGSIGTYLWTKQSGPAATLSGAGTSSLSLTNLVEGTYLFRITVTDNLGSTASDEITVVVAPPGVNSPPVVQAGSSKIIALPLNTATLLGSASDPDGAIKSITWTQQAGPSTGTLSGASTTTLTVSDLIEGIYTFRLTATDNENATAFSETTVDVRPSQLPPVVFAGNDTTLLLPDNFLPLQGIVQPGDGFITNYEWIQVDGLAAEMVGDYPDVSLANLFPGVYVFRLSVTDNSGNTVSDDVTIKVLEGKSNPLGASLFFSPNGDVENEVWTIKNTNMIEGCPVTIFNSLGKKVYSTDEYLNDWNGYSGGSLLKEGDYYFVFKCPGDKTYSGALRLLR